jgi:hypothetical protein
MVSVIDHAALRFTAICLATSCKNAVICSMLLGDIFADPNMLAGFVSTERSMSIAFSNVATWNASDEATTGSDAGSSPDRVTHVTLSTGLPELLSFHAAQF